MMSLLSHTEPRCLRLLLVCRPIVCVCVCVWGEALMGPQWVALHKNVSDEARLDRELRGGGLYHLMALSFSLAYSPILSLPLSHPV